MFKVTNDSKVDLSKKKKKTITKKKNIGTNGSGWSFLLLSNSDEI